MVQALVGEWSVGGGVRAKRCPPQAFKRQWCSSPEHQIAEFSAGAGFILF